MKEFTGQFSGHKPWVMTQNQRGPTCGLTAINVAYRILTGWTLFATKGQFRDFNQQQYRKDIKKGNENTYVLRRAAKELSYSAAGEIVNADDLAHLANLCGGIQAEIKITGDGHAGNFVHSIRKDINEGGVPLVLFYVIPDENWVEHTPSRAGTFQHWVPIYAIEHLWQWLSPNMTCINGNRPLKVKTGQRAFKDQLMMWSWGKPWITDGEKFGEASALSIDWVSGSPRKWIKHINDKNIGKLNWEEILPTDRAYTTSADLTTKVRLTSRMPNRELTLRGYVNLTRSPESIR